MAVRLDQVRDDDTLVKGDGGENKQTKKKGRWIQEKAQGIKNAYKGLQERTHIYLKIKRLKTYLMLIKMQITHIV